MFFPTNLFSELQQQQQQQQQQKISIEWKCKKETRLGTIINKTFNVRNVIKQMH